MFRAARGQTAAKTSAESELGRLVTAYDLRHAAHLTKEQVRAITSMHEGAGRNLSHSLGAYLRVLFEADVVSVEQLTYSDFLGRLPEVTYLCSLNVAPMNALAVLQLDLQIAFPLIDILLGGQGQAVGQVRDATEIEEELLEGIVGLISRELDRAWSAADININFGQRQLPSSVQRLFPPLEKTLVISFELRMPQVRGVLNLAFPAVVANTLMRKLLREIPARTNSARRPEAALREVLLGCEFMVTLRTPPLIVEFNDLLHLAQGSVLPLPYGIHEPLSVGIGEEELFAARPVKTVNKRGAQLVGRTQPLLAARSEVNHEE